MSDPTCEHGVSVAHNCVRCETGDEAMASRLLHCAERIDRMLPEGWTVLPAGKRRALELHHNGEYRASLYAYYVHDASNTGLAERIAMIVGRVSG